MISHFSSWAIFAATEAEAVETVVPAWIKLLLTAGVFLIPYGLGILIARGLKLKEYAFKISVVLFAATLGLMPFAYQILLGQLENRHYHNQEAAYQKWEDTRPITDADIAEIRAKYPKLKISGVPTEGEVPKMSASGN